MATILPDLEPSVPLGQAPEPAPKPRPKPIRKAPRSRHARPKLMVGEVMKRQHTEAALAIGRRAARRGMPEPGREGDALNALLDRLRGWAGSVAPQYALSEFLIAAQDLSGNRELRQLTGDLRLAELRQVTGGWESRVQRRKRLKLEEEKRSGKEDGGVDGGADGKKDGGVDGGADGKEDGGMHGRPDGKKDGVVDGGPSGKEYGGVDGGPNGRVVGGVVGGMVVGPDVGPDGGPDGWAEAGAEAAEQDAEIDVFLENFGEYF